jgi:hypothetical protein
MDRMVKVSARKEGGSLLNRIQEAISRTERAAGHRRGTEFNRSCSLRLTVTEFLPTKVLLLDGVSLTHRR